MRDQVLASSSSKTSAEALRGKIIISIHNGESKAVTIFRVSNGDSGFDTGATIATSSAT